MRRVSPDEDVKEHIDQLLSIVFAIYGRLSLNEESEQDLFPPQTLQQLIYDNQLFDVAKFYDIAATFGPTNPEAVTKMISSVFDRDLRYI